MAYLRTYTYKGGGVSITPQLDVWKLWMSSVFGSMTSFQLACKNVNLLSGFLLQNCEYISMVLAQSNKNNQPTAACFFFFLLLI